MKVTGTPIPAAAAASLFYSPVLEAVADMSHDDIRRAIGDALGRLGEDANGWRPFARDVWDDAVVYEWDGKLWRAGYTITEDGEAELGDSVEVRVTYTPVAGEAAESLTRPTSTPQREALVRALESSEAFRGEVRALLERLDGPALVDLVVDLVESAPAPIVESAVAQDGTALVKLIEPGWGSTGYYSPAVLERDMPKAFPAGTKMLWDHPTDKEHRERPEGSLTRLAAELLEDASFRSNGPAGPGAYAKAKVFGDYREAVDELAPHIGVSIRGRGRTKAGTAEGRTGPIVDEITEGVTADFVTMPGAGGQVVQMFEAAGRTPAPITEPTKEGADMTELEEARKRAEDAERELAEAKAARERAELAAAIASARTKIAEALADVKLPKAAKERITEAVAGDPPMAEGVLDAEALEAKVKEAVEAERRYLAAAVGSGKVVGLGEATDAGTNGDGELSEAERKSIDEAYEGLADTIIGRDREAERKGFLAGRA